MCICHCLLAAGCTEEGGAYYIKGQAPSERNLAANAVSPDPDMRAQAITKLSSNNWGLTEKYLKFYALNLKSDESPVVRSAAARALGRAADAQYVPNLAAALSDPSPAVRRDAAVALDGVPADAAVGPLQKAALQDSSVDVRIAAIKALRNYRDAEVSRTLLKCLAEQPFGVSYEAHASLVFLTGQDGQYDVDDWIEILANPLPPPKPPARPWWDWGRTAQQP
ncbi:MAG: HEAT repeat domain-containing protein, partial [Phycisphaerae bacterium]